VYPLNCLTMGFTRTVAPKLLLNLAVEITSDHSGKKSCCGLLYLGVW